MERGRPLAPAPHLGRRAARRRPALLALADDAMTAAWLDRAGSLFAGLSLAFAIAILFFPQLLWWLL